MLVVRFGRLGLRTYIFNYLLFRGYTFFWGASPLAFSSEGDISERTDVANFSGYIVIKVCDSFFPSRYFIS